MVQLFPKAIVERHFYSQYFEALVPGLPFHLMSSGDLVRTYGKTGLCPGHDQPIMNYVFKDWADIDSTNWRTATPGHVNRHCDDDYEAIASASDSYHFFLTSAPWCADLDDGCDQGHEGCFDVTSTRASRDIFFSSENGSRPTRPWGDREESCSPVQRWATTSGT